MRAGNAPRCRRRRLGADCACAPASPFSNGCLELGTATPRSEGNPARLGSPRAGGGRRLARGDVAPPSLIPPRSEATSSGRGPRLTLRVRGVWWVSPTAHERGSSPFPYFGTHVNGTIVHTNLATSGTYTEVLSNNFADHKIVDNGDGTITDTIRATGVVRFYDQFGNFVLKDPGTIWFAVEYDYNGTPGDPDDDVEVPDSFRVIKPSTGNSDFSDRNFCDDLRTYTAAPYRLAERQGVQARSTRVRPARLSRGHCAPKGTRTLWPVPRLAVLRNALICRRWCSDLPMSGRRPVNTSGPLIGDGRLTESGADPVVGGPGVQCVQQLGERAVPGASRVGLRRLNDRLPGVGILTAHQHDGRAWTGLFEDLLRRVHVGTDVPLESLHGMDATLHALRGGDQAYQSDPPHQRQPDESDDKPAGRDHMRLREPQRPVGVSADHHGSHPTCTCLLAKAWPKRGEQMLGATTAFETGNDDRVVLRRLGRVGAGGHLRIVRAPHGHHKTPGDSSSIGPGASSSGGTIVLIALQKGSDVMVRLLVRRRLEAFLRDPLSVRNAMAVIIAATLVSVLVGGVLITVVDPEEFPDLGTGLWWALQTVTTVGYGDVTPENTAGRLVGALFLLEAISFVTIVTAVITSSFVERARQQRIADTETAEAVGAEQLIAQLSEITSRLDRIQQTLDSGGPAGATLR